VLEELGTYDPMVPYEDARIVLNSERVKYWLGVGAQPSEKVKILIKKYGPDGTRLDHQKAAMDRLAQDRRRPTPPPIVQHAEMDDDESPAETHEEGSAE
jgi:small subunit ribosomal protein S16